MALYINSNLYLESFKQTVSGKFFVDKSAIISDLIPYLNIEERFLCITRPRRFGKTVAAKMIASFFGKYDSRELFKELKIKDFPDCFKHLNRHNVVFIDFSKDVDEDSDTYSSYIERLCNSIKKDIFVSFPDLKMNDDTLLSQCFTKVFEQYGQKYIFVFDEWDAPFQFKFMTDEKKDSYLQFLRDLLKDRPYVELAYMTGVLPVRKYSSGSDLNMFMDFSMANQTLFSEYFGFTEIEVDALYDKACLNQKVNYSREDLKYWYDGYETVDKIHIYNPRSVICALTNNMLSNYWTGSGPCDEIFDLLKNDVTDIQKPVGQMLSGESVSCIINEYSVNSMSLASKDSVFSAMVVYGLLTSNGVNKVKIPNYEIKQQFEAVLRNKKGLGYIAKLAKKSEEMIQATLDMDETKVCEILEYAHNIETPIFSYNNENELASVVNLLYLAANDDFYISREDKAGKGFADFVFISKDGTNPNIILELKVDSTAEKALDQIKQKEYTLRFSKQSFSNHVLLVGISYSKKTKKHYCKIEKN